ncbi:FecR family protein [Delftia sp. PS-11]|uniref:FecR family protein n=1 Tax=Delftia sp. PS-11 TaxID=2767222 RepID=UPI0024577706|nr:FecR domain-containing protein [Delftia sp. PS-11]KAJ8745962.1 FecR domain-containing protein [Delftia sp. PS-11]
MNSRHSLPPPGRSLTAALLLAFGVWATAAQAGEPGLGLLSQTGADTAGAVGKVTLALGKALVIDAAGRAQAVRTGSQIHAGDRIETAEGGHVHIRFVDGALVSVRPTSRLVVEDYQYDARQVEKSLVRFRLDQGVARAISGAAAEGARERFRLNTPLVAIGVRGTDFVVRTDAVQTLASVNQGAIVVAPFGAECQPQATGPCGTGSARLLTASMGQMLVEYRDQFAQPEIRPINSMTGNGGITVASSSTGSTGSTGSVVANGTLTSATSSGSGNASSNSGSTTASSSSSNSASSSNSSNSSSSATTTVAVRSTESLTLQSHKTSSVSDEAVSAVLVQGAVHLAGSEVQKPSQPPTTGITNVPQTPLVWGRWTDSALMAGDITIARSSLREARKTDDVIGFGDYILFRSSTTASVLAPQLGVLGFSLQQSQAQFIAANGARQAASVLGGSLTLDFASRQFNTLLQLTSAATGNVGLQAGGEITQQGAFYSYGTGQSLAGAVALDAKSAGYTFEKSVTGGMLNGITLWGR